MARWPEWFRRVGDGATNPRALDVGKKLLGYLAVRRQTPGVQTLTKRVVLDDGTVVEASFYGDQPQVTVYSPDGLESCELYVESGLLDLGPNIAPDANKRFNRGVPEFDDKPATLHFGDGVDCKDGAAGLNGKIRVNPATRHISSECLPKQGRSVQSRLTDPKKKQAQALLPASCWSGLMQRYVQAVYGGAALKYSADGNTLTVEGVAVGGYGSCVGLVEVGGEHEFVFAGSGPIYSAKLKFKSSCGEAVYRMWKAIRASSPAAHADKILSIALSEAYPSETRVQIGDAGALRFASPYGWQFNKASPEAHAVSVDATSATLKRITFTRLDAGLAAEISDVEVAALPPIMVACKISGPGMSTTPMCASDAASSSARSGAERGSRYEHPVGCYYDDGELVVVHYIHDNSAGVDVVVIDGTECGAGYSPAQRQNISIPGEDGYNYTASLIEDQGDFFPAGYYDNLGYQHVGNAVTGFYAKREDAVLWSTVENTPVLYMKTTSGLSPYAEYVGGSWVFLATFNEYVPAGTLTSPVNYHSGSTGVPPVQGFSGINYPADQLGSDPLCGRAADGYYMNCGDWSSPPITEACAEGETRLYEISWVEEYPIAVHTKRTAEVSIIAGAFHEVALPRGDCSAHVCARINKKGCYPRYGLNADAANHSSHRVATSTHYSGGHLFVSPQCSGAGAVVGTTTLKCNGTVKQTVPFSGGSAEHLSACTTCWTDAPFVANVQVAAFMRTTTKLVLDDATASEKSGGVKLFGDASLNTFAGSDWTYEPSSPFEFLIDSEHGDFIREYITSDFENAPTAIETADGETSIEEMAMVGSPILQQGFDYLARRGLLDAKTRWSDAFAFGASINMDRETITGGYPTVSTPSFVGWA